MHSHRNLRPQVQLLIGALFRAAPSCTPADYATPATGTCMALTGIWEPYEDTPAPHERTAGRQQPHAPPAHSLHTEQQPQAGRDRTGSPAERLTCAARVSAGASQRLWPCERTCAITGHPTLEQGSEEACIRDLAIPEACFTRQPAAGTIVCWRPMLPGLEAMCERATTAYDTHSASSGLMRPPHTVSPRRLINIAHGDLSSPSLSWYVTCSRQRDHRTEASPASLLC